MIALERGPDIGKARKPFEPGDSGGNSSRRRARVTSTSTDPWECHRRVGRHEFAAALRIEGGDEFPHRFPRGALAAREGP